MKPFEHALRMIVTAGYFAKNITIRKLSHRFESVAMSKCVNGVKINKYNIENNMCVIKFFNAWNMQHLFDSYANFYIEFDTSVDDTIFKLKNSKNIETIV